MKIKTLFFSLIFSLIALFCFAQEKNSHENEFDRLFENYQKNSTEFQKCVYQLEQADIALEKIKLQNGFRFSLSTGPVEAEFSTRGTELNIDPELKLSSKNWNNTSITFDVPYSHNFTNPANSDGFDGAGVLVSTEIISPSGKQNRLAVEKAERAVLVAERAVMTKIVEVHIAYLNELKKVYTSKLAIYTAENEMFDKLESFNTIKAKGYAESSAKYRTAKLEVESKERTVEEKRLTYEANLAVFASKCSVPVEELALEFEIPEVELIEFVSMDKEKFTDLETAQWNQYINDKNRNIDTTFSLSAQTGYSLDTLPSGQLDHDLMAGAKLNVAGVTVSTLASIPLTDNSTKSVSVSLGWDPYEGKIKKLNDRNNVLASKIDALTIVDANEKYRTAMIEQDEKRRTLDWQIVQYKEEVSVYESLENDTSRMYTLGLVAESEYRKAQSNYENAKAKLAQAKIERVLYNDTINKMFIPLSEEEK